MNDGTEELEQARARLDQVDAALIDLLAARFRIIEEVAAIKQKFGIRVMQPERVQAVLKLRSEAALKAGLKKPLVDRLWRELIGEACRIENDIIGSSIGDLQFQAIRIDHVAIAVNSLQSAVEMFQEKLGFKLIEKWAIEGEFSGMEAAVLEVGNVTFVVVQGTNPKSNVCKYIEAYGPGIQHIAIEVDNIVAACNHLAKSGLNLIGDIYEVGGVRQAFSDRDPITGMQIEIVSRSSDSNFEPRNVANLFKAMEARDVF
jgi:methylmalonyl-CoA epimerase